MTEDERKLQAAFLRQREEESRQAQGFGRFRSAALLSRAPDPQARFTGFRIPVLAASGALAAAAVLALFIVFNRDPRPVPEYLAGGTWRAPTDFLLVTPGREHLGSLPSFGSGPLVPVLLAPASPAPSTERSRS